MEQEKKHWRRYRFKTNSIEDSRPLIFNPKYPFWESGFNSNSATMVAYLPNDEDLLKYWDDAFNIEFTEHDCIEFSGRFQKPSYFIES